MLENTISRSTPSESEASTSDNPGEAEGSQEVPIPEEIQRAFEAIVSKGHVVTMTTFTEDNYRHGGNSNSFTVVRLCQAHISAG